MALERKLSQQTLSTGPFNSSPGPSKLVPGRSTTRERRERKDALKLVVMGGAVMLILVTLSWSIKLAWLSSSNGCSDLGRQPYGPKLKVFSGVSDIPKDQQLRMSIAGYVDHIVSNPDEQRDYLRTISLQFDADKLVEKYDKLLPTSPHLAQELWKYCALYEYGGMYLDSGSLLWPSVDSLWLEFQGNVGVESSSSFPGALQGSLVLIRQSHSDIAKKMVHFISKTTVKELESDPLLIPKKLYSLAQNDKDKWYFLDQTCSIDPMLRQQRSYFPNYCPKSNKYCCKVQNPANNLPILLTGYPLLPIKPQPLSTDLPKPFNSQDGNHEDHPFISTLHVKNTSLEMQEKLKEPRNTPNIYNILKRQSCVPGSKPCFACLRNVTGATKESCKKKCPCYAEALCETPVAKKLVSREIEVKLPLFSKDPSRMIPRIVHQTWFEDITQMKYPNMKRLSNSWKESGWDYRFYNDTEAVNFLLEHFPPEVKEAYDALIPGAFKADLFRYCVLLVYGGVYADTDVMLESNLDQAIGPHVSFMVATDSVGIEIGKQMCLWNGLMAVAPGHPFIAKAIETAVNQVRNRFTIIDIDNLFCPNPELSILHRYSLLFPTGPCMLGASVNKVLGRHGQTHFQPGAFHEEKSVFPGKIVILKQNKKDMGAHRFTLLEKNMVIAATDMPDFKDDPVTKRIHYANQTRGQFTIYGAHKLYVDHEKANEDIRIIVRQHSS